MCHIPCTAHLLCNHYTENITRNPCPQRGYLGQSDIAYCPYPILHIYEEKHDYCFQCQRRIAAEQEKAERVRIEAKKIETAKVKAARLETARLEGIRKSEEEEARNLKEAEAAKSAKPTQEQHEAVRRYRQEMADEEERKMFWPEGETQYSRDVREGAARHRRRSQSPETKWKG